MQPDIQIRHARSGDLQSILNLVNELAVYEQEPEAVTCKIEEYQKCFETGIFDSFVAEVSGEIVGMTLYYYSFSTWKGKMLYLEDFVIKKTHRGLGIGQLLFEILIEEAKAKDCRLMKWQVLDWNTRAQNFYSKYGAIIEQNWWNGKIFL